MDLRLWKKILLQWITECGFTERNFYNLEQSDLEEFFQNFCLNHRGTVENDTQNIISFLQEHYPKFNPILDDENLLSSAEYVYVYSLLLHFCCVKDPESYFHEICKKLSEQTQQNIADYFKQLLDCEVITKESLRHAIANVPSITESSPQSSGNSPANNTPPIANGHVNSPANTPIRQFAMLNRISPSTPKSFLLEERTRELYQLRALLDTERYEKGLLEVQLKQNEEKITKLSQDQKRMQQVIHDLRNELLYKTTEACSTIPDDEQEEQLKKRLCKEISQKEEEITKITSILNTLKEEKDLVTEKLSFANSNLTDCIERINQLEATLDEQALELEAKSSTILYLTNSKLELEQFIAETRKGNNNLNSSNDFLDNSFSQTSNGSGSQLVPENLANSVVDKQLREKEVENSQLREELATLRSDNSKLDFEMQELLMRIAQDFSLSLSTEAEAENDTPKKPEQKLLLLSDCIHRINTDYKSAQCKFQTLTDETHALYNVNSHLNSQLKKFDEDVRNLKDMLKSVESRNSELEEIKNELKEQLSQCKLESNMLAHQKTNIKAAMDLLTQEFEEYKATTSIEQNKLLKEVKELKEYKEKLVLLTSGYEQFKEACKVEQEKQVAEIKILRAQAEQHHMSNTKLNAIKAQLQEEIENLQCKLRESKEKLLFKSTEFEMEVKVLNEKISNKQLELMSHKSAETLVKEKYEKLFIEFEDMKTTARDTKKHLEEMREEISSKELQMSKLGNEIIDTSRSNVELEERINILMEQYKREKEKSGYDVAVRENQIRELSSEKLELEKILTQTNTELEIATTEALSSNSEISNIATAIEILMSIIEKPFGNSNLCACLEQITTKVKNLTSSLNEVESKFERLSREHTEVKNKLEKAEKKLEHTLDDNIHLTKKMEHVNTDTKKLLKLSQERILEYERRCDKLTEEVSRGIVEMEKKLKERDEFNQVQVTEVSNKYENTLHTLREELKSERHFKNKECSSIKKKLLEAEKSKEQLELEKSEAEFKLGCKLKTFEGKLEEMTSTNNKLSEEIIQYKLEHNNTVDRLGQLSISLREACDHKNSLLAELKSKEEKIQTLVEELELSKKAIQALEDVKSQQIDSIINLKEEVEDFMIEKQRLDVKYEELLAKLDCEQKEKATLLQSLEKTVDQLKESDDNLNEATKLLEESEFKNINLIKDYENRLQVSMENLRLERNNWELKFNELQQKLFHESEKLKSHDTIILEIVAGLENYKNLQVEHESQSFPNRFNAKEGNSDNLNKLKTTLNSVVYKLDFVESQLEYSKRNLVEMDNVIKSITKNDKKLKEKLDNSEKEILQLKKMLEVENICLENKLSQDLIRMKGDMQNLEAVNEKLSAENADLQIKWSELETEIDKYRKNINTLRDQNKSLLADNEHKKGQIDHLRKEHLSLEGLLQAKEDDFVDLKAQSAKVQKQLLEKTEDLAKTENEISLANGTIRHTQSKLTKLETQLKEIQKDLSEQNQKYARLQTSNGNFVLELEQKTQSLEKVQLKHDEMFIQQQYLDKELKSALSELDSLRGKKADTDSKYAALQSELKELTEKFNSNKIKHDSALAEIVNLTVKLSDERTEKRQLSDELKISRRELQQANDNITELIQQISSVRSEKESCSEETQILRKQIEQSEKAQSEAQERLKSVQENSLTVEKQLLQIQNEFKTLVTQHDNKTALVNKLTTENDKLRENHANTTKRLEKLALKLGDVQARCSKLERDNERLSKTKEGGTSAFEYLQRERDTLQEECKSLKERINKIEIAYEHLKNKVQNLEKEKKELENDKINLVSNENEIKTKFLKLEKMRECNEEKLRKLNQSLANCEQDNVRLNLEVGALNNQLLEACKKKNVTNAEFEKVNKEYLASMDKIKVYEDLNKKLEREMCSMRDEHIDLTDQISKLSLGLEISKTTVADVNKEIGQLRTELLIIREEKTQLNEKYTTTVAALQIAENKIKALLVEKEDVDKKMVETQIELESKNAQTNVLQKQIDSLQATNNVSNMSTEELEKLQKRFALSDALLLKEKENSSQLLMDNQILQAKYRDLKVRFEEQTQISEKRIKENRLELEGKLEKMKNKMKTLYTEETTKMSTKHEREIAICKSEMEIITAQNKKYEEHTRKLSSQIVRLNDNILEYQKQNAILKTKLKHLEDSAGGPFKRPSMIHVSSTASLASANGIGTNLAMEDEEGEVFNNTYLTDLKNGRCSDFMNNDMCAEELRYRNSLVLPHLKSSYAPQYDVGLNEDELKDGPHSLDDSMIGLLSTTAGSRKKVSGVTHYKKPGPPTPSKNGGRLSFGGCGEQGREILKECKDDNNPSGSSVKTPARFAFFSSRFSMGNPKDEDPTNKNFHLVRLNDTKAGQVCTSTPRKSRIYFDQRRLIDSLSSASSTNSNLKLKINENNKENEIKKYTYQTSVMTPLKKNKVKSNPFLKCIENQQFIRNRRSRCLKRRLSKLGQKCVVETTSSAKTDSPYDILTGTGTTSSGGVKSSLQSRLRRRKKRDRGSRPSIYLCSNIFARQRAHPRNSLIDINRRKARKQRNEQFNKYRPLRVEENGTLSDSEVGGVTFEVKNNNYANFNHNTRSDKTVVITKSKDDSNDLTIGLCNNSNSNIDDPIIEEYNNSRSSSIEEVIEYEPPNGELGKTKLVIEDKFLKQESTYIDTDTDCDEFDVSECSKSELIDFEREVNLHKGNNFHLFNKDHQFDGLNSADFTAQLNVKESKAPFEIKPINFSEMDLKANDQESQQQSSGFELIPTSSGLSNYVPPTNQTLSPSAQLSRIIYTGNIIYSRRIPNVNMTHVRKSSIYIKSKNNQSDDVVLVTNQTITIVDLYHMWCQMNVTARCVISFSIFATLAIFVIFGAVFFYGF
ncbi:centromere-associated protein E isoform X2 [Teleopsis dalmanni]|nr:centromere-associated protein E isoform X2 [Teleopsis dalmanni]